MPYDYIDPNEEVRILEQEARALERQHLVLTARSAANPSLSEALSATEAAMAKVKKLRDEKRGRLPKTSARRASTAEVELPATMISEDETVIAINSLGEQRIIRGVDPTLGNIDPLDRP